MLRYIRRAAELPPRVAARKATELVRFRWKCYWQRMGDRWQPDPLDDRVFCNSLSLTTREARERVARDIFRSPQATLPIRWSPIDPAPEALAQLRQLAADALEHRFELLGSGPVRVDYTIRPGGVEGHRYEMAPGLHAAEEQRRRMESLLPGSVRDYTPIDWHTDFKSGYRWRPDEWFLNLRYGHLPGMDVKVPWDLSRLQHVGVLGLVHRLDPGGPEGARAPAEFVSQVVDWIAANPSRRGVNWLCTMDVAIRAVNWLIGLSLFDDAGELTPAFRWLAAKSLYAHGLHIESHLEYSPATAGNHYLANVVGLLCIGAAMPELPESDRWLLWGIQELVSEMNRQVLPDGADFEGSTGYHFLVAEMFYLGTAVALRLGSERRARLERLEAARMPHPTAPPLKAYREQDIDLERPEVFPSWYLDRLLQMAEFGADLIKPDGTIPLIGDHDSGRLYKLWPAVRTASHDSRIEEECREYRHVPALGGRLFGRAELAAIGAPFDADATLILSEVRAQPVVGAVADYRAAIGSPRPQRYGSACDPAGVLSVYGDAGVALAHTREMYLAVSFGRVSKGGTGGHYHNDVLSFELSIGGVDFIVDGGSYLYTPAPAQRNAFRSVRAHSTIAVGSIEQRSWPAAGGGLFTVVEDASVRLEDARPGYFSAECRYKGVHHARTFRWDGDSLRIEDSVTGPGGAVLILNLAAHVRVEAEEQVGENSYALRLSNGGALLRLRLDGVGVPEIIEGYYSPGYGERIPSWRIVAPLIADRSVSLFRFG